jgi:predicted dienelactone hydrolase
MEFAIDQVEALNSGDGSLAGKLDLERIGLLGHSFGGAAAAEACRADARCKGAAVMDVPLQGEVAMTGLSQPILLLDAEKLDCPAFIAEVEKVTGQPAPADFADFCPQFFAGREASYDAALNTSSAGYHLSIDGSRHGTFGDMGYLLRIQPALQAQMGGYPTIEDDRGWRVSSDLVLAFFDQTLNGGDGALLNSSSADYPEVVFVGSENAN